MQLNHINDIAIRQMLDDNDVEADVWFVGISDDGEIFTQPWWECDTHPADLAAQAIRLAIKWNERIGVGEMRVKYFDLRSDAHKAQVIKMHEDVTEDFPPVQAA